MDLQLCLSKAERGNKKLSPLYKEPDVAMQN